MAMRPFDFVARKNLKHNVEIRRGDAPTWSSSKDVGVGGDLPTSYGSDWSTPTECRSLSIFFLPIISTCSSPIFLPFSASITYSFRSAEYTATNGLGSCLFLRRLSAALASMTFLPTAEKVSVLRLKSQVGDLLMTGDARPILWCCAFAELGVSLEWKKA
jgi:hypothetical protein